jgi:two-component system, chemotaxis family, protein-glutamate methylesterase/glutaminase
MAQIKVLVVDDSFFMRKVISDILTSDPDITVVGQANDGLEALGRIAELHPDVVTLDIMMPKLGGFSTLERIVATEHAPAVLMVSAYTKEDAEITLDCLSMGAIDFVLKPSESAAHELDKVATELLTKVRVAAKVSSGHLAVATPVPLPHTKKYGIVVIGSSTGGPVALEQLLPLLPENLPCPVLVAQHLPNQFVSSLTDRLAKHCKLPVETAVDEGKLSPGTIYFAPGGANTEVVRSNTGQMMLSVTPSTEILTPSVDKLMISAAKVYRGATLGIILTGMGEDGLKGMRAIKEAGGHTIVQDEQSSVVFGMGRAVAEHGLADNLVPLEQIAEKIL